jgi:hypothetical protein
VMCVRSKELSLFDLQKEKPLRPPKHTPLRSHLIMYICNDAPAKMHRHGVSNDPKAPFLPSRAVY